jgi:hypothetical protein
LRDAETDDLVGREPGDIASIEDNLSFARLRRAADGHHERRLARAIRADDRDDLARENLKARRRRAP